MNKSYYYGIGLVLLLLVGGAVYFYSPNPAPEQPDTEKTSKPSADGMSFFLTGINPGKGANLGGLTGADSYCQSLATSAGAGSATWRAYLSTQATEDTPAINARDRIGSGPWKNFRGEVVASNLDELHGKNNINKQTALTEKGETISGRGDQTNQHDILTGSASDGRAIATSTDVTCGNWTKSTDEGAAMVGHHDRLGLSDDDVARSWNSSHLTRGCSQAALPKSGGAGLFYCFAAN
ncbi:hypothetical protein HGA34_00025 [Candidatus Falkowbacteria bacterium]|nr:hypothetical protein [Candidatus Falkowbacteria bacterium]